MRIIVDAFGGDNSPVEIVKGCIEAKKEYDIDFTLVGTKELDKICSDNNLSLDGFEIVYANDVISQEEDGTQVVRGKYKECTIAVGARLLREDKGDAFISAGNSGAICAAASSIVGRIKGVKRAGYAPVMPNLNGCFMMIDVGANLECRPEMLIQFAKMGSIYMEKVMGKKNPTVGLANIGTEDHKGLELQIETNKLLKETDLNYVGNVEARDIPIKGADVIVSDGYTGNLILKTYEGTAKALLSKIKGIFKKSLKNKLAAAMILGDLNQFKKEFDYNEYGGAPIIGCKKPVFKAHGSANANTFKNALRLTKEYVENAVVSEIEKEMRKNENE